MRDTVRTTARLYVFGASWLFAMLGTAWLVVMAMDTHYAALGLDPLARTMVTMAVATLTATTIAGLGVKWLSRARPAARKGSASGSPAVIEPLHDRASG